MLHFRVWSQLQLV